MKQACHESRLSMTPLNNGVRSCWYSSLAYFTGGLAGNLWRPCEGSIGSGPEKRGADLSPRPFVYRLSCLACAASRCRLRFLNRRRRFMTSAAPYPPAYSFPRDRRKSDQPLCLLRIPARSKLSVSPRTRQAKDHLPRPWPIGDSHHFAG
jgi:hypothetical protein